MDRDEPASESEFLTGYPETDGVNAKYRLLRRGATRLRRRAIRSDDVKCTDDPAFVDLVRACNGWIEGPLLVFAANDFGWPVALRPKGTPERLQEDVRRELLREKYKSNPELDRIRRTILDADSRVHQALVARHDGNRIDYHLPGG